MTNQMRPGVDHTRVPSNAAMRARDVSRDPEAEARGLRAGRTPAPEPPSGEDAAGAGARDGQPPADRPDS
jgi:hypothetical protein